MTNELTALDRLKLSLAAKESAKHVNPWLVLSGCSLDTHATKHNWVEDAGGLPEYICQIAKEIHQSGKDISSAIAIAVSRCKVWAAGGGGVNADTRAKAAKAIAEWEAKKAKAKGSKVAASAALDDEQVFLSAVEALTVDRIANRLELASADNDADEASENEPQEGSYADLMEDLQEALDDFQEAYTSLLEVVKEVKKQIPNSK